jgi:hypothetical protein
MLAPSVVAEGGLTAHLRFDESSGYTAYDSADAHDGSLKNMEPGTDWVTGKINGALAFDGTNEFVEVPDHADLDFGTGDFSVSFWVNKRAGSSGWDNIWGVNKWHTGGATPGQNEWTVGIGGQNDNKPTFSVEVGTARYRAASPDEISLNAWHHLVGVRNGGSLLLYVDGEEKDRYETLGSAAVNNVGRDLYVASSASGRFNPNAIFDDLQIYDTALVAWQVETMFANPGMIAPVPEPTTLLICSLLAALGMGCGRWRRKK